MNSHSKKTQNERSQATVITALSDVVSIISGIITFVMFVDFIRERKSGLGKSCHRNTLD